MSMQKRLAGGGDAGEKSTRKYFQMPSFFYGQVFQYVIHCIHYENRNLSHSAYGKRTEGIGEEGQEARSFRCGLRQNENPL